MGNELQNFRGANLPSAFANGPIAGMGDMTEGVSAGFPVVSFKGKVWKIKSKGDEHLWLAGDGSGQPAAYVEVVICNASSAISKIWYEKQFREGEEMGPPDCWSTNGVVPDAAAPRKPSPTCAGCPKNVFGTSQTGKGKACGDVRRLAVVPAGNIHDKNGAFGGPMLMRVPPTSLSELAGYQRKMGSLGYPYYAVVTRIAFDPNSAFQKLLFTAVRPLNEDEARSVVEMGTDDATQRMLNETVVSVKTNVDHEDPEQVFEQGTGGIKPTQAPSPFAPATASTSTPTAAHSPASTAAPAQQPTTAPSPAPVSAPADPFAVMRGLVVQGVMTKEQFKGATGQDYDPPAAAWSAKPEHQPLVGFVQAGQMTPAMFLAATGYAYGGQAVGNGAAQTVAAAPATAPAPTSTAPATSPSEAPTRKRRTKQEIDAEKAAQASAAPAGAAPQEQIEDANFVEQTPVAGSSLDAALDGLFN